MILILISVGFDLLVTVYDKLIYRVLLAKLKQMWRKLFGMLKRVQGHLIYINVVIGLHQEHRVRV